MYRLPSDNLTLWVLRFIGVMSGLIVVLILLFLILGAMPAIGEIGITRFFTDASWHPSGDSQQGQFGLMPMLAGTLLASLGAMFIAAPLGVMSALFARFYAPPMLARMYRGLIELMAGVPSVVYGFWGLVVLTPIIRQWEPPGPSLLAAILILALMILPTVSLLSEASLEKVPREAMHGAIALGLSRWAMIRSSVLPAARGGIITALLLAMGRAIGETMAVLMVAGNVVQVPGSVFDPVRTVTANIALELGYAMQMHRSALFVSGLLLMVMVIVLVVLTHWSQRDANAH